MSLGSKQSGSTQTVQSNDPWIGSQAFLMDIFQKGARLNDRPNQIAPQSSQTLQAQNMQSQRALAGSPLVDSAQNQALQTINGGNLNPYTQGALGDVMDMTKSKINSQFGGDNFGNSAHQEWLGRGILSASMPFAQQAHESERGRQMQAMGMAPLLAAQDYADIDQLGEVGASKDARAQQELDFPWQSLFNYQKAISGNGNLGGTSTTSQPYFTNPMGDLASTALTGAMAYSLLSDRRLKRDIKQVGTHPVGVPLYTFKYLWSDEPKIGVMADELEQVMPEAVIDGPFKMVNYGMIQ